MTRELFYTQVQVTRSRNETKFIVHGHNYTGPRMSNAAMVEEATSLCSTHAREAGSRLREFIAYGEPREGYARGTFYIAVYAR